MYSLVPFEPELFKDVKFLQNILLGRGGEPRMFCFPLYIGPQITRLLRKPTNSNVSFYFSNIGIQIFLLKSAMQRFLAAEIEKNCDKTASNTIIQK